MTYDPTIPASTSSPKTSAANIQANFSQFSTIFSKTSVGVVYNHMALNDANAAGKHAVVRFQRQTADPGVELDLDVLYCKNATLQIGVLSQLFLQIPTFLPTDFDTTKAANTPMLLTYNQVNTAGPIYQSFLIGGYILYFGSTTNIATPIVLSPAPKNILCVQAIPQGVVSGNIPYNVGVVVTQPKTIKINSSNAPGGATFLWLGIGTA